MPEVSALQYALQCLSKKDIMLPWFVYTGGGFEGEAAISYMVKGCERNYDDRDYYKKPLEMNLLFEKYWRLSQRCLNTKSSISIKICFLGIPIQRN